MVSSLSFSQSRYPLQTVIDGDSVVILTKAQADTINAIFDSQKAKIAKFKQETKIKDSIISLRDTLLVFYSTRYTEYKTIIETQIIHEDKLDTISEWLKQRAIEGAWIYYSFNNQQIIAVDLSDYVVRKDDYTGDLLFYKMHTAEDREGKEDKEPPTNWHYDVALPNRPKLYILNLK